MSSSPNTTILITGGAGFIGGNFVRHLSGERNVRLIVFDALTYAGNIASIARIRSRVNHIEIHGKIL